jgi:magnesium-transporting ATPase (P-type)
MDKQQTSLLAHAEAPDEVLVGLRTSHHGLSREEAEHRLEQVGKNSLPRAAPPGIARVFLHQFASPLIYVLLAAALLSLFIQEWSDAGFIFAVLIINALIGTMQEFSAQRAAEALHQLVTTNCRVLREGEAYEINAEFLVPGDIVLIESGDRVPADLRLLNGHDLEIDESLLTGESEAVLKDPYRVLPEDTVLGDKFNMAFAGSMVIRGRAQAVVVATALGTELGRIAEAVLGKQAAKAPLLVRMEKFTHRVALFVGLAAIIMAVVAASQGMPLDEIFLLAVALAVSAIPEGLPVALTVALAIGMRRMARRHVIVRRLLAMEALGSCTFIATDKTGTLTVNQLTVKLIVIPGLEQWEVTGEGLVPEGMVLTPAGQPDIQETALLRRLCEAAVLANDGFLGRRNHEWVHHGDAVDVALLIMAHKAEVIKEEVDNIFPMLDVIPYESERQFAASLNRSNDRAHASVKGAVERVLAMCGYVAKPEGDVPIVDAEIEAEVQRLAALGYRVMALAAGPVVLEEGEAFSEEHLRGLTLLGLVGMIDPLRPEAGAAIDACRKAGIDIAMVTGDHPLTALAIARQVNLAYQPDQVVTGTELKLLENTNEMDQITRQARVYARVEPRQKLQIVESLQRNGHFVAVTGDGANDAPALRAAQVGVAMGRSGTDVARDSAALILTDDNFASIVAGIEEGRIAYANVRKVIFLLISTGAAELVLFTLALFFGLPLPLLAVQLLWLNLVTNGIQDIALAFEPGEGDELDRPPRSPKERIFNRIMIERVVISALVIGVVAFLLYQWLLERGFSIDEARNGVLLLMVLFENIHVFNSRSETRSVFRQSLWSNRILLIGTLAAQGVHIAAMYTPWISDVLRIQPISLSHWLELLAMAVTVLIVMELHKLINHGFRKGRI